VNALNQPNGATLFGGDQSSNAAIAIADPAQFDVKLYNDAGGEWSTVGPFGEYKPESTANWATCEFYIYRRLPALEIAGALHFNFVNSSDQVPTDRESRIRTFALRGIGAQGEGVIRFCNPSKFYVHGFIQQGLSFVQPPFNRRGYVRMQPDFSEEVSVPSLVGMGFKPKYAISDSNFIAGACDTK